MHNDMRAVQGIIIGVILGAILWSLIGLAYIYFSAPVTDHVWTCVTDTECELEAARLGLPIDKD